jgi:transcriptional regulator with XRE-family HTH domain
MGEFSSKLPLKSLGIRLKVLRQKQQESIAEVADAVEIDEVMMKQIEQGIERPSEDILMLLISHFGIQEDAASDLWILAGYDDPDEKVANVADNAVSHPVMVMMALDVRILYSDQALLAADKNGVVINFMQEGISLRGKAQKMPVARVGMSYEQAQEFLRVLHNTLSKADDLRRPKGLPTPKSQSEPDSKQPRSS